MSKPISTKKKYYECQCDKHKGKKLLIEDKFYSSNSPLFGSTHKVPICKSCISDMIDYNNINTIYKVLQIMDIPFDYETWEKCSSKNSKNIIGVYLRQVKNLSQWQGKTWKDSIFNSFNNNTNKENNDMNNYSNINEEIPIELINKWGNNYTIQQIEKLEKFNKDMMNSYDVKTASHKDYLKKICKVSLKMDEALDNNEVNEFQKLSTVYDNLMKSAKFTAVQRSAVDDTGGFATFSEFIEALEKEGFIEPKKIEEDYDIVEATIADIKNYTKKLVLGDTSINSMAVEQLIKNNSKNNESEIDEVE